jgi:hypothetical protein
MLHRGEADMIAARDGAQGGAGCHGLEEGESLAGCQVFINAAD